MSVFSTLRAALPVILFCSSLSTLAAEEALTPLTVRDLMVGAIEPATNAIWALALEENEPQDEAAWKAVENEAIQLLAATSAMSLGGSGEGEQALAKEDKWQKHSQDMARIALDILKAARGRNYEATLDASNFLVEPCSACHADYPPRKP